MDRLQTTSGYASSHNRESAHRRADQALFALIQGGLFEDLRRQAARAVAGETVPGFAIGGLSVGEPKSVTAADTW